MSTPSTSSGSTRRAATSVQDLLGFAKYIVIRAQDGTEQAILFPAKLQHRDMLPRSVPAAAAISAGFYQILDHETLLVGGHSDTLNLRSRPQDEQIIRNLITSP